MNPPLFSVIICTYNRAELLGKCLDSFTHQQPGAAAFEVIVVDNNSSDNTKSIVSQYQNKIPDLKYIFEQNQGLSYARNRGCAESKGEYLIYIDDDATVPPEYLVNVTKIIKSFAPDIMGGPVYPYYVTPRPKWFKDEYEIRKYAEKSGFSNTASVSGGNFIILKKILEKLGEFDVNLGMKGGKIGMGEERKVLEDYRASVPVSQQKVYYALECYINHYVSPDKMTFTYQMKRFYRTGRDSVSVKNRGPEFAVSVPITLLGEIFREVKTTGIKLNVIKITLLITLRFAIIQEIFKRYGFRAVIKTFFNLLIHKLYPRYNPNANKSGITQGTMLENGPKIKRKTIKVLWLIEHVAREMDVACAVKYLAKAKYNVDIEIRHIYLHTVQNMEQFNPRVVVLHAFYNSHDLAVKDYVERWPSATFFNAAWEEIFYKGHVKIKAPADDFTRQKVIHHAWGNFFKQYLMEYGVKEGNIFLNGNPAYELYLPPYNKYYPDRKWLADKYRLDLSKRWVIVPENYRWAFIKDGTIDWRVREGADRTELLGMRDFARDSLIHLLKWCNEAAKDENLEIIFRPKPVTMLTEMEDFFNEYVGEPKSAGLHFIKGESVREWILGSDVVISSFSTTLIESAIAGKPAYMVEPIHLTESFEADWYEYVPRIHTAAEFHDACIASVAQAPTRLRDWAAGEMLANGDPISNLAKFLSDLTEKPSPPVSLRTKFSSWYRRMRYPYRQDYFNPRTHENDSFDDDYINQKVKEWSKVL